MGLFLNFEAQDLKICSKTGNTVKFGNANQGENDASGAR